MTENFSAPVMERSASATSGSGRSTIDRVRVEQRVRQARPVLRLQVRRTGRASCSGLSFVSGLPEQPPAGWGFAYMDHMGAYLMAAAVLAGLIARNRTGKGQWIDFACTEAGIGLAGPELLDATVNGRPMRRPGKPNSNTDNFPAMVPHGVYAAAGQDSWVAIACRDDDDWRRLAGGHRRAVGARPEADHVRGPGRAQRRDRPTARSVDQWTRAEDGGGQVESGRRSRRGRSPCRRTVSTTTRGPRRGISGRGSTTRRSATPGWRGYRSISRRPIG